MNSKKLFFKLLVLCIGFSLAQYTAAKAQTIPDNPLGYPVRVVKKDTVIKDTVIKPVKSDIKKYSDVVKKTFITQTGLFKIHRYKKTTYFEIPDSLLNRDLILTDRVTKASYGVGKYPGENVSNQTISFEIGSDSTIVIRNDLVATEADPKSNIYKAVKNSETNPVLVRLPILAFGPHLKSYVIDVSELLSRKSFFTETKMDTVTNAKKRPTATEQKDYHIEYIHTYPINVEIAVSHNFNLLGEADRKMPVSMEMNISFILLPKVPLTRRYRDDRIGYMYDGVTIYTDDQQSVKQRDFILRWRLEPRDADTDKWKRGELVEPKKQIVIYVDPAAPKQWHPYLIAGINDWQKAFEQAGFKNAIVGKEWPENDITMHMDDARYSFLNYFPSEVQNAYGPQIHDPRSGEIIQTHIGWYSNVTTLLHNWYMIQAGAIDPKARKARFDDELMGQLIRFVSSHEVGHTLGLAHNFGSSSQTPVDSLRSKHYLGVHGHTASIMDYARFNYVAQPEDQIPQADIFPRIGEYDKWAIEWGYKRSGAANAEEDKKITSKWADDRLSKNRLLWFGNGEDKTLKFDPRAQMEDMGDNPVTASNYGIKNLQRVLPNLPAWTKDGDNSNNNLSEAYTELRGQYFTYMRHVIKYAAGGYYRNNINTYQKEPVYVPEPKELQRQALDFFDKQLFHTPIWLLNPQVADKVAGTDIPLFIDDLQEKVINSLLDINLLDKIRANTDRFGTKTYSLDEYITTIHRSVWRELLSGVSIKEDSYRRNLQKTYFGAMEAVLTSANKAEDTENDDASIIKADLSSLQSEIKHALLKTTDPLTLYHFKDIADRIEKILNNKHV